MKKIRIEYIPVGDIKPYENNPRKNDGAVDALAESVKEFGFKNPILVDRDGVVIAGHTRLKAALKLGLKEVPVVYADDLTEEQARALRLADNKICEIAEWDIDKLESELSEILSIDMSLFGFGGDEGNLADELMMSPYSQKIDIPQYEITGACPDLQELLDTDKSEELIAKIDVAEVTEEEKEFLRYAAQRHNVFNYRNIAEYYAHATPQMQELMEQSALVIIDVDDAIANGYVELMAGVLEEMGDSE